MITDKFGILATWNDKGAIDTGDSLSNESFARLGCFLSKKDLPLVSYQDFKKTLSFNGQWYRGTDYKIGVDEKFLPSRDQLLMLLCYLFVNHDADFWTLLRRLEVCGYPNNDIVLTELKILKWRKCYYSPFLFIADLWLLGNTFLRIGLLPRWRHETKRLVRLTPDDVGDDKIHVALLSVIEFSKVRTWVSRLARYLYFKYRPENKGSKSCANNVAGAICWYYRIESGNNEEIFHVWKGLLNG